MRLLVVSICVACAVPAAAKPSVRGAEKTWRASCPVKPVYGLCMGLRSLTTKGVGPGGRCGPAAVTQMMAVKRDDAQAQEAVKLFARAGRHPLVLIRKADRVFESYLAVQFPPTLDLSSGQHAKKAQQLFADVLKRKSELVAKARDGYKKVTRGKWSVVAAARIGQIYGNFGDELATLPIPSPPIPKVLKSARRRADFVKVFTRTYCQTTREKAEPLYKKAQDAFTTCVSRATKLKIRNRWSRLCTTELEWLKGLVTPTPTP